MSLFWQGKSPLKIITSDASTQVDFVLVESQTQTELNDDSMVCVSCQTSFDYDGAWNHEVLLEL